MVKIVYDQIDYDDANDTAEDEIHLEEDEKSADKN
jgi:hypothetical protein